MIRNNLYLMIFLLLLSCSSKPLKNPYVIVLGTTQDGGAPHAGCNKKCCVKRWSNSKKEFFVTSLGIVDPNSNEAWMIDATPDFPYQHNQLSKDNKIKGIFITHAHIGHYAGLMYLGRETMGYKNMPLYTAPKMTKYLQTNGPWSQLIDLKNVKINRIKEDKEVVLNKRLTIKPFIVPHRDEFSETVGYKINGPQKSLIFIPDIDKWNKWNVDVLEVISDNEFALLDGTFFNDGEVAGRDMSEIPHPFIIESIEYFEKIKNNVEISFIHFNHTNPLLNPDSDLRKKLNNQGYGATFLNQKFEL